MIFERKVKNHPIVIRYPNDEDALSLYTYINDLSKERTFIRFQGEEITLSDEQTYLQSQLKKISQKKGIQLLVFCENELIGVGGIEMQDRVNRHTGLLGISIHKDFRGEGIGSLLLNLLIDESIKNFSDLQILTLTVFSNNLVGLNLYKKYGFIEYGRLPNGIKLENQYVDHIFMYKIVG